MMARHLNAPGRHCRKPAPQNKPAPPVLTNGCWLHARLAGGVSVAAL
jgi:hypothetical protein